MTHVELLVGAFTSDSDLSKVRSRLTNESSPTISSRDYCYYAFVHECHERRATAFENGGFVRRFIIRLRRVASLFCPALVSSLSSLPCLTLNSSPTMVYLPLKLENSWYPVLSESTDRNELASGVGRCKLLALFTLREIPLFSPLLYHPLPLLPALS